jgi:nitrogen regulatory protein PII
VLSLVTAVVKPHKLLEVKDALNQAGVHGLTVSEVKGFGRQGGHTETYRGAEYSIDFVPKVKIEVVVATPDAETIAGVVSGVAQTGRIGAGKIWVTLVEQVVRIRTGEKGLDAL